MNHDHRKQLLAIMSGIGQQIATAEKIVAAGPIDDIRLRAAKQLADLHRMLADVERKLVNCEQC